MPRIHRRARRCPGALAVLPVAIAAGVAFAACQPRPGPPDILLLVVDTLRADHLGLHGYARPTSPELDRFAESAVVLTRAHAPSSWTLPTVGSILTGTYPSVHGLRARHGRRAFVAMRPGVETLAAVLREAGYRTVAVVTNPWVSDTRHGLDRGFERYRALGRSGASEVNRVAREILSEADARPLFLYLHYMDVHGPYDAVPEQPVDLGPPPAAYRRVLSPAEQKSAPRYLLRRGEQRLDRYVDAYDRGVAAWDEAFGRLVGWLRAEHRLDETVLVVVSDHGEEFLEHGGWNHGETLYQEQLAIPWVMHVPGHEPRRIASPVSLIDLAPTLLTLARVAVPDSMAGRDVLAAELPVRDLYAETDVRHGGRAAPEARLVSVMRGREKLIRRHDGEECFDLVEDPEEQRPRTTCDPALGHALTGWLRTTREQAAAAGSPAPFTPEPSRRDELRALGYVE